MFEDLGIETSLWEIALRGSAVYLLLAIVLRLAPKRHSGSLSPNDMIALVIIGSLAADGIRGDAMSLGDLLLMGLVIVVWDYIFNLAEFYFPRLRQVTQDSPTLLIHNGQLLQNNLRKEKLTEQEVSANLRKHGIEDIAEVRYAVLEVDGQISVIEHQSKSVE
ncbi:MULTISPECIES: DUF421 domain-containing protein [Pseudomonadaceae]|uniref:DUF421 domain-containing protein n=1 Tax=Pseudomonadaceae TaxID=135621 RepID=UPI0015E380D8|nr:MULTISPECIES: YetF domain-containing protein [Pseudomonadaceae]MBA1279577.1 DUF421 domain-containing protein [Stutzerimonas stutzeri]MBC8649553.1 DUF421 domain-containing protein [Pseudomonas sp. MT4]QXY90880.1 DUF421 domain-containing protein [Pseudomonas sp. MTM4]